MKETIKKIPVLGQLARYVYNLLPGKNTSHTYFESSAQYWDQRYASGGNSGVGSYDKFATFKAEIINSFVDSREIETVIEFGCGDGNQLSLANYPAYTGVDVSQAVIQLCKDKFSSDESKNFFLMSEYDGQKADLSLSLDVIYHLVEDDVFDNYMRRLFSAAKRFVIIYSSDSDDNAGYEGTHVRHRKFSSWIEDHLSNWKLVEHIANKYPYKGDYKTGSFADFFIYERTS